MTVFFAALAAFVAGCGGAELVNLWKDPVYPREPMRNLLVVALRPDPLKRRLWEDSFCDALHPQGAQATASYRLFPTALPDTQQVVEAVRSRACDGVIVIHRLANESVTRYVPGYTSSQPVTAVSRWSGAYYTAYDEVEEPGHTETEEMVRYQVDVWSTVEEGRMVWSGTSQMLDPGSGEQVRAQITGLIVPELARTRVIPEPRASGKAP